MLIPFHGNTAKEGLSMAQYTDHLHVNFDRLARYIEDSVLSGSVSATKEGGSDFESGGVRCVTQVYERYSWAGNNRLSLCVTLFGRDGDVQLSAVTSGGSQAMFMKLNTWGEESFLKQFVDQLAEYKE